MAELNPDETQPNGGALPVATTSDAVATAAVVTASAVGSKRQRRPSVRLGEIGGDQYHHPTYDSHVRRSTGNKQLKSFNSSRRETNPSGKSSRTKTLTHLSCDYGINKNETLNEDKEGNIDSLAIGGWQVKKRAGAVATKRVRSNWVPKMDENQTNINQFDEKYSGGEELEDGYRDFTREDSESPINSQENLGNEREGFYSANNRTRYNSSSTRARVSENRELEISSDMDGGDWRSGRGGREGVRIWLDGLGLGKYWPFFEIHEVDDEVLPLLTLEDLKDMGINAVGSRRKMYCAIQKLGKEFS